MLTIKSFSLYLCIAVVFLITCSRASQPVSYALQQKRARRPLANSGMIKRNLGGKIKDWYLMQVTHNYFCTSSARVVPVDPDTGHMLLKSLRKRDFLDGWLGHSKTTEKGLCKDASWVLPDGWTQPIPKSQFLNQYPWMDVDDRGQPRFKPEFFAWLQQRAANGPSGVADSAAASGQYLPLTNGANGAAVPYGGVGYVPASYLSYQQGTSGTAGLGQNTLGNGVTAGAAAHI
ncbi:uncharacterized protein MEPE_04171 [Melanopsichium pennsylvanicum]|uniref:Uncharacterized protein n=2 Tax=Melanopsichium pennsylvanicum TaxID=63383 RepID=A0AAJ4XNH8_9BASI|nr:hypothetical protein BN887_05162 [Melanopsichium pennsylvanicum 4]SNX85462.1 uncharacterized protein MEPE_04171 [Melanopsichium pennsylvanicum]